MTRPNWVPEDVDDYRPTAARLRDYCRGGSHRIEADRALAKTAMSHRVDGRLP
jgi:hypothetical protein